MEEFPSLSPTVVIMQQKLSRPPFRVRDSVALAYVKGRYTPPGPKPGPVAFFGIYISRTRPRLSFCTFDRAGGYRSFSMVTEDELNIEYALIRAWLHDEVPFDQWRFYEPDKAETRMLRSLRLREDYDVARKRLAAVLYQARVRTYCRLPKVKPIFTVRPRSAGAMRRDVGEYEAVMKAVGLR